MFRRHYSIDEYEGFEAAAVDAGTFVRLAAKTGRRHLTITSPRDGGFSMYHPSLSDDKPTKAAERSDGLVPTVRLELS